MLHTSEIFKKVEVNKDSREGRGSFLEYLEPELGFEMYLYFTFFCGSEDTHKEHYNNTYCDITMYQIHALHILSYLFECTQVLDTLYSGQNCVSDKLGNAAHKQRNLDSNSGLSDSKAYSLEHCIDG